MVSRGSSFSSFEVGPMTRGGFIKPKSTHVSGREIPVVGVVLPLFSWRVPRLDVGVCSAAIPGAIRRRWSVAFALAQHLPRFGFPTEFRRHLPGLYPCTLGFLRIGARGMCLRPLKADLVTLDILCCDLRKDQCSEPWFLRFRLAVVDTALRHEISPHH